MHKRKEQREPVSSLTIVKALLAIEVISLLIALAVTFGPSRTGTRGGFARLFMDDPSVLVQVVVNFAVTNVLLTLIAAVFFVVVVRGNKSDARRGG